MRVWIALLALLTVSGTAVAGEPPFDLRALRGQWPGYGRVVLEQELRITALEGGAGLRLAVQTRTAVLTEADRDDLNLFSQDERPGCRVPGGIRIEVFTPDGASQLVTQEDMVRVATGGGVEVKGPRPGVQAGALIQESYHVDHAAQCFDGMVSVEGFLGAPDAPVLREALIVACPACAVALTQGLAVTATGDRRELRRERVLPPPPEPHAPDDLRPAFYVSTSSDPLALGRALATGLTAQTRRWSGKSGAWAKEARSRYPYLKDRGIQLAWYLEDVMMWQPGAVWERGLRWGDPVTPDERWLEPTEWLALAMALLGKEGGVPLLLADQHGARPPGVGSVFDWDQYGVLLPGRGVLTSTNWEPFASGLQTSLRLGDRVAMLLEEGGPRLHRFPVDPSADVRSWHTTVEASGTSSLLVSVDAELAGSWGAEQCLRWRQTEHRVKKARGKLDEEARDFGSRLFDQRRLTATTITVDDQTLGVSTAWTIQGGQRRYEGGMSLPVPVPGLDPFIRIVDGERVSPIRLGAAQLSGSVRVKPIPGTKVAGLPAGEQVGAGPIRLRAAWTSDAGDSLLTWSLHIDDDVLPADRADEVAAVGAAMRRLTALSLVLEDG